MKIDSVLSRNEEIMSSNMDGDVVMMNIATGKYYNLGSEGGSVWELLKEPLTLENLIEKLTEIYQVSAQQCMNDVLPFLQHMKEQGLLMVKE